MKRTHSQSQVEVENGGMESLAPEAERRDDNPEITDDNPVYRPPVMQQPTSSADGYMTASTTMAHLPEDISQTQTEPTFRTDTGDSSQKGRSAGSAPRSTMMSPTSSALSSSAAGEASLISGIPTPLQSFKALITAIKNKDLISIERLIQEGAPLTKPSSNARFDDTQNALFAAIDLSCLEALPCLIKHPDINIEKRYTHYVYRACLEESKELFDFFVHAGFAIEHLGEFPVRDTAIISYVGCYETCESTFEMLFRAGANPNTVNPDNMCSSYMTIKKWADDSTNAGQFEDAEIWNKCAASFESWGLILGKPDAIKEAIEGKDFTRLERQVRHDLRSAGQRVDPDFLQSADSLDRLDMPAVAADLLRFPELTRPRTAWQPKMPAITGDPSKFSVTPANGGDWRHKLLEAGFARPLIDFLEKKLGKNLELLAFIAPPSSPSSSSSDEIIHVHRATPSQIWSCLKFCTDDLREESTLESLAAAYRGKGLTEFTERKLVYQLKAQAIMVTHNLSPENNVALTSFERSVETLVDTCWQFCPSYAGGNALLGLEAALRDAGMLNALAARVVKAWSEILESLKSGTFTPPVLREGVDLLDTPQGEKIANLFGEQLLANLSLEPSGLPPHPAFDPIPYINAFVTQLDLIKRFAEGAIEFTRTA
ncbi:MAG: ankyrin repeat domain-containing protein [Burkholderiaceae bacterium]|nr:ankyrin repeat domain-containing protein [Burkholderiaceae bacterium]